MNWIDALIVLTLAWFSYSAFNAGLIREVVTILGAILAVALAGLFYTDLAEDVIVAVDNEKTARIVSFIIIFAGTVLASQILALFLKHAASILFLGLFDSLGGAVIGFIKGFVFVEIFLIFFVTYPSLGLEKAIDDSVLAPFFLDYVPLLLKILPDEFESAVHALF